MVLGNKAKHLLYDSVFLDLVIERLFNPRSALGWRFEGVRRFFLVTEGLEFLPCGILSGGRNI
jgi:hypothetical protein